MFYSNLYYDARKLKIKILIYQYFTRLRTKTSHCSPTRVVTSDKVCNKWVEKKREAQNCVVTHCTHQECIRNTSIKHLGPNQYNFGKNWCRSYSLSVEGRWLALVTCEPGLIHLGLYQSESKAGNLGEAGGGSSPCARINLRSCSAPEHCDMQFLYNVLSTGHLQTLDTRILTVPSAKFLPTQTKSNV